MSLSLVPDVKQVFTPALVRERLRRYEMPPGINGISANGLYSSSLGLSSLNGKTSKRLSGIASELIGLLYWVRLLRSFFLGWDMDGACSHVQ